ncbi:MAG: RES family NAD+ phosphorylase [Mucilaginibacter polytrichastri]|nr:RES family NAD+ phosphorylase [Mucilaginibacter polytrichastri]
MIVFRLSKAIYSQDLTGHGPEKHGGRWNLKGIPMIYTASSRALAVAEIAVHTPLGIIPADYQLIQIEIPEQIFTDKISIESLPENWAANPPVQVTRLMGTHFIRQNKHAVLQAPSACVQGDFNFLINPLHPDARQISIIKTEDFKFDSRLFLK